MTPSSILIVIGVAVLAGTFAGYMAELSINNDEWLKYVVATVIGAASLAAGVLRRLDTGE